MVWAGSRTCQLSRHLRRYADRSLTQQKRMESLHSRAHSAAASLLTIRILQLTTLSLESDSPGTRSTTARPRSSADLVSTTGCRFQDTSCCSKTKPPHL